MTHMLQSLRLPCGSGRGSWGRWGPSGALEVPPTEFIVWEGSTVPQEGAYKGAVGASHTEAGSHGNPGPGSGVAGLGESTWGRPTGQRVVRTAAWSPLKHPACWEDRPGATRLPQGTCGRAGAPLLGPQACDAGTWGEANTGGAANRRVKQPGVVDVIHATFDTSSSPPGSPRAPRPQSCLHPTARERPGLLGCFF